MGLAVLVLASFIFTCSNCASAEFTVIAQDSPVVVSVGDVAVITCRTLFISDLVEVQWIRTYAGRRYAISVFQDGRDQQRCDLPEYVGRIKMMKDDLARGSASLKLFNVSLADEGTYHCFLETADYFDIGTFELRVTALGSDPRIDLEGFQDGGIKAVCRSSGWYPEPTLVNKDDNGEIKIRKEVNGLYSIEYSRVIIENSNRTFSCQIRTLSPHQERESSMYVADGLFQRTPDCSVPTIICSVPAAIIIIFLVVAVAILWYQRSKSDAASESNKETLPLTKGPEPSVHTSEDE